MLRGGNVRALYKIIDQADWELFQKSGAYSGAAIDLSDGFIHFSYAHQVRETAEKHFRHRNGLLILACDPSQLGGALRDEPSRGGDLFPHLYAALPLSAVRAVYPAPLDAEGVPMIDPAIGA